eukprot:XP_014048255.1 PREDICTED: uncharacterized protein LOC106600971 [Salmo salar]
MSPVSVSSMMGGSDHESVDRIILSEDGSPSRKRQISDDEAKNLVESILKKKPGDVAIKEYSKTKSLTDRTRRKMINILVSAMTETHGTSPPRSEHYYDANSGEGYLSYRIKTIQRNLASSEKRPTQLYSGVPTAERLSSPSTLATLGEDQCREAMKLTFEYRKKMTHDPGKCSTILTEFPRFLDVKGLIEQDFVLLFGEGTSDMFLERWPTTFKQKIIMLSKTLSKATRGAELQELIQMAESAVDEGADTNADGSLSSILLLLHLIPPSSQGRKIPGKMSASQAEQHLVIFQKAGTSIQEHLDVIDQSRQPYLLAVGTRKSSIHAYYFILDKRALLCKSTSALGAFDELFKTHFVFGTIQCCATCTPSYRQPCTT